MTGDIGREPGWVEDSDGECLFLPFLRDVSVPLASDRLGDPRRFRDTFIAVFFDGSVCFKRPDGVVLPFEEAAESFLFFSSSTFRSSSLALSSSVSSELCMTQGQNLYTLRVLMANIPHRRYKD